MRLLAPPGQLACRLIATRTTRLALAAAFVRDQRDEQFGRMECEEIPR